MAEQTVSHHCGFLITTVKIMIKGGVKNKLQNYGLLPNLPEMGETGFILGPNPKYSHNDLHLDIIYELKPILD